MASSLPSDWDTRRKRVYQRDNYTCQNCGAKGGNYGTAEIHAHHIVPKGQGGSHKTTNLISLCKECHNTVHSNSKQAPTATSSQQSDFGEISDTLLKSILKMISSGRKTLDRDPDMSLREFNEQLSENASQLRSTSLQITNAATKLEEAPRDQYPQEVVIATENAVQAGINTIEPMLEAVECISESLDQAVEEQLTCPSCRNDIRASDDFCSSCGMELESLSEECSECGTEIDLAGSSCPNCGSTPNIDDLETNSDDLEVFVSDVVKYVEEMESAADRFQDELSQRQNAIEVHS